MYLGNTCLDGVSTPTAVPSLRRCVLHSMQLYVTRSAYIERVVFLENLSHTITQKLPSMWQLPNMITLFFFFSLEIYSSTKG